MEGSILKGFYLMQQNEKNTVKKVIVFGAARSGIAASRFLSGQDAKVFLVDESPTPKAADFIQELAQLDVSLRFGKIDFDILKDTNLFVLSPGIPTTHPFVQEALKRKISLESELEIGAKNVRSRIIGITGTNGKTTVTTLTNEIISKSGISSIATGNIGYAICDAALLPQAKSESAFFIVEVSSFQLEIIHFFHPYIAVLLNLAPDHQDRYSNNNEYYQAKFRITENQTSDDFLILNAEDENCRELAKRTKAKVLWFSRLSEVENGAFVKFGKIWINSGEKFFLMDIRDIPMVGNHNIENVLASSLAAFLAGATPINIAKAIREFKGVEHRIEPCVVIDEISFFNDSKSTNLASLKVALLSFEKPIIVIVGGRGKETHYFELTPLVKERVKKIVTLGENSDVIEKEWGKVVPFERAQNMENAITIAFSSAEKGDVILLSPGHKSFDLYKNYEERGHDFKRCIERLVLLRC